ncbi:MAG: SRPBCC family protein [Chryseolinea sp.]
MIIEFALSQNIECSIDKTFSFLSDLRNMPRWNYFIQRVTKISEGKVEVGTIYEQKRSRDKFLVKVVEFTPPHKAMFQLQPPGPDLLIGFSLIEKEGQTHVQYNWKLDVQYYLVLKYIPTGAFKNWILSVIEKQILTKTKPAVEQNFAKLKTLLETGEVVLQDGRKMKLNN